MKYLFLWLTFPIGHIIWMLKGFKIWTFRKKKKWYYLPMYSDGRCCLYFYKDIRWATKISKKEDEFISGVLWSAQFIACSHGEGTMAEDMLLESGFTEAQFLKEQTSSGYESRKMCKIIRRAFAR